MAQIVVDASGMVEVLTSPHPPPELRRRVLTSRLYAPELFTVEVLNVLRRRERRSEVTGDQVERATWWLARAPIGLAPHRPLLGRTWELRHSIRTYDAAYVALAEQLDVPLVTTDAKLAGSNGHSAEIELYPAS